MTTKRQLVNEVQDVNKHIHLVAPICSASAFLLSEWEMAVTFAPKALAKSKAKCP